MMEFIDDVLRQEATAFFQYRCNWTPTTGPKDIELVAHALRVVLNRGRESVHAHADDFLALAAIQGSDGGWASPGEERSGVWASAFAALMLVRSHEQLHDVRLKRGVERAIDYFLASQHEEGHWVDIPTWTDLDATSHPVSFFNVVRALGWTYRRDELDRAWANGLRFLLDRQADDGGWCAPEFKSPSAVVASGSPIEMTAHLLQDAIVPDLLLTNRMGVLPACTRAIRRLTEWQACDGSWDKGNTDHTMDSVRALMLASRILDDCSVRPVIERAIEWIVLVKNDVGWGNVPGDATNLERLCDGLDTLIKYRAYHERDSTALFKLWGFLPERTT